MVKVAILHEGRNNKSADSVLLRSIIKAQGLDETRVSFFPMQSKSNFFKTEDVRYRRLIKEVETDLIEKVLLVVDADFSADDSVYGGSENSLSELEKIAIALKIDEITEFYISCDPATGEGNVEDLLLSSLSNEKRACINDFLECSDFKGKEKSKAILNQIYKIAYPEAPFDFEHDNFSELKEKLRELLS